MKTEVTVDNRVRVPVDGLDATARRTLERAFEHYNPQNSIKKRMLASRKVPAWLIDKQEPPVIKTWREVSDDSGSASLTFPRGGYARVIRALEEVGVDWEVVDAREHGTRTTAIPEHRMKLWPHQARTVEGALEREQCIIRSPTGGGKTSALIAVIARLKLPSLVVMHSRALLEQWQDRVEYELGLKSSEVGRIGGGARRIRPITLALQRSVASAADKALLRYFGAVFMDEVHMASADTFFSVIDLFPARYRIGASADHRRKDRKECLVHDLFGEVAVDIGREVLVEAGHVLDVEVRVVGTRFEAPWYGVGDVDKKIDFVRLVKEMQADPNRNGLIYEILEGERNEQALVMVHEREHASVLHAGLIARGFSAGVLLGGPESAAEFGRTMAGMKRGEVRVGVGTYKAIGTGIDLPRVAVAVAATPIAANEQFFGQVRGRVCRVADGKTSARLYYLLDSEVFPRHLKNIAKWNSNTVVRSGPDWVGAKEFLR